MYLWGILYDDMKETIPILLQQKDLVDGVGKVPLLKIVHYCIYADYGNTGSGVFKGGDFCLKINILEGNH